MGSTYPAATTTAFSFFFFFFFFAESKDPEAMQGQHFSEVQVAPQPIPHIRPEGRTTKIAGDAVEEVVGTIGAVEGLGRSVCCGPRK